MCYADSSKFFLNIDAANPPLHLVCGSRGGFHVSTTSSVTLLQSSVVRPGEALH